MEKEKFFLKDDFKISDLVYFIDFFVYYLLEFFNNELYINFVDYINGYRI